MPKLNMQPWPPHEPFPESVTETYPREGSDFPSSGGEREHGKFRPSATPRLTTIAVVDDDGNRIGQAQIPLLDELILELRKLRLALMMTGFAADVDGDNFDDIR